jgi:hypothetical protein
MTTRSISGRFTADGDSAAIAVGKSAQLFVGTPAATDFGGGDVFVRVQGPDGAWYVSDVVIEAATVAVYESPVPSNIRLSLEGATSPELDYAIVSDLV